MGTNPIYCVLKTDFLLPTTYGLNEMPHLIFLQPSLFSC